MGSEVLVCLNRLLLCFFLSDGKAECVKDVPAMEGSLQDWKPGLYYGIDDQCRIAFGSSARACSFTNPDLVCHLAYKKCPQGPSHVKILVRMWFRWFIWVHRCVFVLCQPACRVLSCHVNPDDDSSCKRLLVPLLDGTECALNQVLLLVCLVSLFSAGTMTEMYQ